MNQIFIWCRSTDTLGGLTQAKEAALYFEEYGSVLSVVITPAHPSSSKAEITKCFVHSRGICWRRKLLIVNDTPEKLSNWSSPYSSVILCHNKIDQSQGVLWWRQAKEINYWPEHIRKFWCTLFGGVLGNLVTHHLVKVEKQPHRTEKKKRL